MSVLDFEGNIIDKTTEEIKALKETQINKLSDNVDGFTKALTLFRDQCDISELEPTDHNYELAHMETTRIYKEDLQPTIKKAHEIMEQANIDLQSLFENTLAKLDYDKKLKNTAGKLLSFLFDKIER